MILIGLDYHTQGGFLPNGNGFQGGEITKYLSILFSIDMTRNQMWNWVINKLTVKLEYYKSSADLSLAAKIQVGTIFEISQIYLICLFGFPTSRATIKCPLS